MGFKDFIKPTGGKIILLIVIVFITVFIGILAGNARVDRVREVGDSEIRVRIFESIEMVLMFPRDLITRYAITINNCPPSIDLLCPLSLKEEVIMEISSVLYWYLLSCLMIFGYKKLKKGKGNGNFR